MPVDLSGPFRAAIQSLLADAKKALESGNKEQAIVDYQQVAGLYRRWANETDIPAQKKQHLQNADGYEAYAKRLTSGASAAPAPASAQMERGDEDEGGVEKQVEHLIHKSVVRWEDIGGLDKTKEEVKIAFALATVGMPEGVKLEGWRTILFYGPPGTGKTMMAAAISNGLQATFFNVALSGILSKYFGESSRLISSLYKLAHDRSPSVLLMDEFESLATQRTGEESGAERRVLSTILSELDGLAGKSDPRYVLTIAATNVPWLLDKAILSRFQRKVLIPLPDPAARESILSILLKKRGIATEPPLREIVASTEWYAGRDLDGLTRAAVNHMVTDQNASLPSIADQGVDALKKYTLKVRPLTRGDWDYGLRQVSPVTTKDAYDAFLRFEKDQTR